MCIVQMLLAGAAVAGDMQRDMRDMRMPSINAPAAITPQARGRIPFSDDGDDDDVDIDADFSFSGNVRNVTGYGGSMGSMPMTENIGAMASGMGEGGNMGGMMMNQIGGMMAGGLMGTVGGMGGIGGMGGVGPMGLMGRNLDGLSQIANTMGQMNVMGGNLRGMMTGGDGNMGRARDSMERGRGGMERGRGDFMERAIGSESRMRLDDRRGGMVDASAGLRRESDAGGVVVHVSNMNQEVLTHIV